MHHSTSDSADYNFNWQTVDIDSKGELTLTRTLTYPTLP